MKHHFTCMIVENKSNVRSLLKKYINDSHFLQLKKSCCNGMEAYQFMKQVDEVDLFFMDDEEEWIGTPAFFKSLKKMPKIITTSSFTNSNKPGIHSFDHLNPTFSYDNFLKVVTQATGVNVNEASDVNSDQEIVVLESGKKKYSVPVSNILYIEGMSNYVKVITTGKILILYQRLRDLEKQLADHGFLRIHKSFIVALDQVDEVFNRSVRIGEKLISIGYSYKKSIDGMLKEYALK